MTLAEEQHRSAERRHVENADFVGVGVVYGTLAKRLHRVRG